jgi:hypothetical protein
MSSIATHTSAQSVSRSTGRGHFAKIGLATVVASVLANVLFYYIGSAFVTYDPDFIILTNVSGAVIFTAFFAVAAVAVYAGLVRFTDNAVRNFNVIAAVFLVVSIVPDYTYIMDQAGATFGQATILALMHVIAAAVIVAMLTVLARPQAR